MYCPIIISDEEETSIPTPPSVVSSRSIVDVGPGRAVCSAIILDDDPTPSKDVTCRSSSLHVIPEMSSDFCIQDLPTSGQTRFSQNTLTEFGELIGLESDNEEVYDNETSKSWLGNEMNTRQIGGSIDMTSSEPVLSACSHGFDCRTTLESSHIAEPPSSPGDKMSMEQVIHAASKGKQTRISKNMKNHLHRAPGKKISKEERLALAEEKKQRKKEEKLQKAALKAETMEMEKRKKELHKWETGKDAIKSIVANIDTKVIQDGSVGGFLLSRFAEKGLRYRIASNPIEGSILWAMNLPDHITELCVKGAEIKYIIIVFGAEEFCSLVADDSFPRHISNVKSRYPSYSISYATNRLNAYIKKREKEQYNNPQKFSEWRCPPIDKIVAEVSVLYDRVSCRLCTDEAELAEHVIGLTCSLATCQFRSKLTRLSVNANGSFIPKDFAHKHLIKKSPWLKALVAIPKVQPRFAVAIWKKYPTMRSLLDAYMDPNIPVHEKELLLEDLLTQGPSGAERRLGQICSRRIYRVLMAQNSSLFVDDIENGADLFEHSDSP